MKKLVWLLVLVILQSAAAVEPLRLSGLFSDNMVLQRDKLVPVWGTAEPAETVVVRLAGQEKRATADANGKWMVKLDALTAGGGQLEMTVEDKTTKRVLKNVMVGEVWLCAGQSNMALKLGEVANSAQEAKEAELPEIRTFTCWGDALIEPQARGQGAWNPMAPAVAKNVSAVAYFFGRKLHRELNVPVGLIIAAVGGTRGEAWTSREGLAQDPQLKYFVDEIDKTVAMFPPKDDQGWENPDFDDAAWKSMKVPVNWQQGGIPGNGRVWFRKSIDIPESWAGKELKFRSGPLRRSDITWFNGHKIGETSEAPEKPREYTVPAQWVKSGQAVLATRITSGEYWAGILGKPEELNLAVTGAEDTSISLAGDWKYNVAKLDQIGNSSMATTLYNGFIAPVVPYAIQGAIWYQGEGNIVRAFQYRRMLPVLIRDWRAHWGQGDFPFGIVQLASCGEANSKLGPCDWAELRESQLLTAMTVTNTGLAVTIDNADRDLHSKTKVDVGERLGLWALSTVYGNKGIYSGPIYKTMSIEGGKIRLAFDQIGGGLVAKGGELKEFAIAGDDQKFVWAEAVIDGETVVVSSEKVTNPVAVRYAWSQSPVNPNLYNKADLPASPFRTDDWPGMTEDKK